MSILHITMDTCLNCNNKSFKYHPLEERKVERDTRGNIINEIKKYECTACGKQLD